MQVRNILVPVDFSPVSLQALDYAVALAAAPSAEVAVLHITDPGDPGPSHKEFTSPEHLMHLLARDHRVGRMKHRCLIEEGPVAATILRQRQRLGSDLVVMGTHGAGTLKRKWLGTQTTAVMGRSPVPVLAVPEAAVFSGLKKVAVATDLAESDLEAIQETVSLLAPFSPELLFIFIQPSPREAVPAEYRMEEVSPQIRQFIDYPAVRFYISSHPGLLEGLDSFSRTSDASMLVMVTHARRFAEKLLAPAATLQMARRTAVPLLAIPLAG
jgi:nucleotide-binding universal stress UspA family protein